MKLLRLGLSDDRYGDLETSARSWHIAQTRLEEASGEPWETVFGPSWPYPDWAERLESSLDEHSPDMVMVCCAAYWVAYPSAPLKASRSRIPLGGRLGGVARDLARRPVFGDRALVHAARRLVLGSAGGAFHREPVEASKSVESALRVILQREEIAVAVRGPLPFRVDGSRKLIAVCEARRSAFNDSLAAVCSRLHVEYLPYGPQDVHPMTELLGDRIHVNEAGHKRRADQEFGVMERAWNSHVHATSR